MRSKFFIVGLVLIYLESFRLSHKKFDFYFLIVYL